MGNIVKVPRHIKFYGATLAMAALVIALLAVSFSAGPTQAQNSGNNYPDPQPYRRGNLPRAGQAPSNRCGQQKA